MELVLDVGLTVVAFIGIILLVVSTVLLSLLTVMLFKLYKFVKKQKRLFKFLEDITSLSIFKRRG